MGPGGVLVVDEDVGAVNCWLLSQHQLLQDSVRAALLQCEL
jgi:hypothetical protein